MQKTLIALLLCGAGLCCAQKQVLLKQPLPISWPTSIQEASALKLDSANVIAILNDALSDGGSEPAVYGIGGYKFAALEKDKLYLVAPTDASGREFFTELTFIHCESPQSCFVDSVRADPPHDLSQELIDIDGDGVDEIIAKDLAGGYEGVRTLPIFTYFIYRIIAGKVADVSGQYAGYYESTLLPRMNSDQSRLAAKLQPNSEESQVATALGTFAQDDYQRRILGRQTAGLEHAKQWAQSGDERLERLAIRSLASIQSSAANDVLTELSRSTHRTTGELAAIELERKHETEKLNRNSRPK